MYDFNDSFNAAQYYAKLGLYVFPCHTNVNGKCSCGGDHVGDEKNIAKHPATAHAYKDATTDVVRLRQFFSGSPRNVAIATGEISGVFVLDVDDERKLIELQNIYGPLPKTWTVETGGGGKQMYFRYVSGLKNAVKFYGDLDIRTDGGYAIAPPSVHASGKQYRWLVSPDACELAAAPQWLLDLVPKHDDAPKSKPITIERAKTETERLRLYLAKCKPAIQGDGGMNATFRTCCYVVECFGVLSDDEIFEAMQPWNDRCVPPWDEKGLRLKISEARKRVKPKTVKDDDGGESESDNADEFPILHADAYCGLFGEIVREIEPHTEADNAALLLTLLTFFGSAVGRNSHYVIEGDKHHANLFTSIVGDTSRARKGTSLGRIRELFAGVDDGWASRIVSGLSSGEGLITAVADGTITNNDGVFVATGGVDDKRLLVIESELASVLKRMKREGNTLSPILRDAWDRGDLQTLTKGSPLRATNAHVAIVSHITQAELALTLNATEVLNGFGNRFLWACAKRSKKLPDGGGFVDVDALRKRLHAAVAKAGTITRMERDAACAALWRDVYEELVEERDGLWDAITSRAEAQTLRLSMLFALAEGTPKITVQHLNAALAVWRYCDDSARLLFGGVDGCDGRIRKIVSETPGIAKTELRSRLGVGHHKKDTKAFNACLERLARRGEIVIVPLAASSTATAIYPSLGTGKTGNWENQKTNEMNQMDTNDSESTVGIGKTGKTENGINAENIPNNSPQHFSPQLGENERIVQNVANCSEPLVGEAFWQATGFAANGHASEIEIAPIIENENADDGTTATLGELFDWRNRYGVKFIDCIVGVWVSNEYEQYLTPAISRAIDKHRQTLKALCKA